MASQMDSKRVRSTSFRLRDPLVPAVLFVVLSVFLNGSVNSVLGGTGSLLPPSLRFEYAVAVPLAPLGAGVLSVCAGVLALCSLALFVRSVGTTGESGLNPTPSSETLRRLWRATGVGVAGTLGAVLGLALFVVPGLVVLVYLPFVFIAVATDGRTVAGAIEASHTRLSARPVPVGVTALGTALALAGLGLGGVFTSFLPPAVEFVVGTTGSALVTLVGAYLLTALYRRPLPEPSPTMGQL